MAELRNFSTPQSRKRGAWPAAADESVEEEPSPAKPLTRASSRRAAAAPVAAAAASGARRQLRLQPAAAVAGRKRHQQQRGAAAAEHPGPAKRRRPQQRPAPRQRRGKQQQQQEKEQDEEDDAKSADSSDEPDAAAPAAAAAAASPDEQGDEEEEEWAPEPGSEPYEDCSEDESDEEDDGSDDKSSEDIPTCDRCGGRQPWDGDTCSGGRRFRVSGGPTWDIVFGDQDDGSPPATPTRACGTVPQPLPTDTQICQGVWARQQADGRHCLFGQPLGNAPKLLERIFGFQRPQNNVLLWRSAAPLQDHEWRYVTAALAAGRLRPLLQEGLRVLQPLPDNQDRPFPESLRQRLLRDASGQALRGPYISRNSDKPWNRGRQFFSTFSSGFGDPASFIWADGVRGFEPEAQESFRQHMGGMLG